jgi:hypothetical protein
MTISTGQQFSEEMLNADLVDISTDTRFTTAVSLSKEKDYDGALALFEALLTKA